MRKYDDSQPFSQFSSTQRRNFVQMPKRSCLKSRPSEKCQGFNERTGCLIANIYTSFNSGRQKYASQIWFEGGLGILSSRIFTYDPSIWLKVTFLLAVLHSTVMFLVNFLSGLLTWDMRCPIVSVTDRGTVKLQGHTLFAAGVSEVDFILNTRLQF